MQSVAFLSFAIRDRVPLFVDSRVGCVLPVKYCVFQCDAIFECTVQVILTLTELYFISLYLSAKSLTPVQCFFRASDVLVGGWCKFFLSVLQKSAVNNLP